MKIAIRLGIESKLVKRCDISLSTVGQYQWSSADCAVHDTNIGVAKKRTTVQWVNAQQKLHI